MICKRFAGINSDGQVKTVRFGQEMGQAALKSRGDRRREAIIDVAREIFLVHGYGAASMSAIAAAVGGSKATLYFYFKTKADLFGEVVRNTTEDYDGDLTFDAELDAPLGPVLAHIGERMLKLICRPQTVALYRVVIAEAGRFPEVGEAFYRAGPQVKIERLTVRIQHAMQMERIRAGDPELAAHQFMSLCRARLHQNMLWGVAPAPNDAEIRAEVAGAVSLFLAGHAMNASRQGA